MFPSMWASVIRVLLLYFALGTINAGLCLVMYFRNAYDFLVFLRSTLSGLWLVRSRLTYRGCMRGKDLDADFAAVYLPGFTGMTFCNLLFLWSLLYGLLLSRLSDWCRLCSCDLSCGSGARHSRFLRAGGPDRRRFPDLQRVS